MIGGIAHGAAAVMAEAQHEAQRELIRRQTEEKVRRHKLKQQQRAQAAQTQTQALTEEQKRLAKAKKAAAAEEAQQGGEGAEGFVAGAAVSGLHIPVHHTIKAVMGVDTSQCCRDEMRTKWTCIPTISLAESVKGNPILIPLSRRHPWLVLRPQSPRICTIYM